jgi:hypothetical protein
MSRFDPKTHLEIGVTVRPHGVVGAIKVHLHQPKLDTLDHIRSEDLTLVGPDGMVLSAPRTDIPRA